MSFILTAANLRATVYGISVCADLGEIKAILENVMVPEFVPRKDVKIQVSDSDPVAAQTDENELIQLQMRLPIPSSLGSLRLFPCSFEKDDDSNFHIDFIAAAANLRALNYGITPADRHKVKGLAGKIIPAIATTTSLVSGLVCLELLKVLDRKDNIEKYKNGFVNLALPFMGFSEPIAAPKLKYGDTYWTLWDRFEFEGDRTLKDLVEYFRTTHNLDVSMVSSDRCLLYAFFMPKEKSSERMGMKITQLIEMVSKKPIPSHFTSVVLDVMVSYVDGDEVDIPYVKLKLC